MVRACVFAHFDKGNKVDEYVYYYLKQLQQNADKIVFVTVSNIAAEDVDRLEKMGIEVIKRENVGYDFFSYKVGIDALELEKYDELILCNDSAYGPIQQFDGVFAKMHDKKCDFWGVTASKSIDYHIQSYFIVYRRGLLRSNVFSSFWKNVSILEHKGDIICKYEVGSSIYFHKHGFISNTFIDNINYDKSKKENFIYLLKRLFRTPKKIINLLLHPKRYLDALNKKHNNTSLADWDRKLLENSMPFLKVSLFTNHQDMKENFEKLKRMDQSQLSYPINLIINHLKRVLR